MAFTMKNDKGPRKRYAFVEDGQIFGKWKVVNANAGRRKERLLALCECACGKQKLIIRNNLTSGQSKSCGCQRGSALGPNHHAWRGGRSKDKNGYVVRRKYHANGKGESVLEHREVMSDLIGRPLFSNETVHHKNGIRDDNRPENPELCVGQHGSGQTVEDRIVDAIEVLARYAPRLIGLEADCYALSV